MSKEIWLKEELSFHDIFDMPVREFIDWCHNRLKEIPESKRAKALLNIDLVDHETRLIEISVSYTSSDVATNDVEDANED